MCVGVILHATVRKVAMLQTSSPLPRSRARGWGGGGGYQRRAGSLSAGASPGGGGGGSNLMKQTLKMAKNR